MTGCRCDLKQVRFPGGLYGRHMIRLFFKYRCVIETLIGNIGVLFLSTGFTYSALRKYYLNSFAQIFKAIWMLKYFFLSATIFNILKLKGTRALRGNQ